MAALRHLVAASFAAAMLAGCSSPDLSGVATYEPAGTGSNGAQLEGRVVLEDECVYVEYLGELVLPVFPNDLVERGVGEPLTYRDEPFHDDTYEDGDAIALGGSMIEGPLTDATVPEGCADDLQAWGVAQAD